MTFELKVLAFTPTIVEVEREVERDGITLNGQPVLGTIKYKMCQSLAECVGEDSFYPCPKCSLPECVDGDEL